MCVCVFMCGVLHFLMHAILISANITVSVTTLPTVFISYAMGNIQEGRALVDTIVSTSAIDTIIW